MEILSFREHIRESNKRFKSAKEIEDFLSDNASNAIDWEDLKDIYTSIPNLPYGAHWQNNKLSKGKYDSLEIRSKAPSKDKYLVEFPKYNIMHIFKWSDKKWVPFFESYIDELF